MARRLIHSSELELGRPLPCDAYDSRGTLLLREGHVIHSATQMEKLLRQALFADARDDLSSSTPPPPSPLALILDARVHLHALLDDPRPPADFADRLLRIAEVLRRACRANAEVALASILMRRDGPYAVRHAVNAAIVCQLVGAAMEPPPAELATIVAAALTMNIGMFHLQQQLQALEGPLSDQQYAAVRDHCEQGVAVLRARGVTDAAWLEAVRDHHERLDGSGYPAGRSGDAIGLPARLLALADIYCARVSQREYRPAMSPNVALRWLFLNEGLAMDERLAALLIRTLGVYPPGTGVRLRNGSIAVVIQRGASGGHAPRVASITTHDGLRTGMPIRRRGDVQAYAVSEVVDLDALRLNVSMEALWGTDASD